MHDQSNILNFAVKQKSTNIPLDYIKTLIFLIFKKYVAGIRFCEIIIIILATNDPSILISVSTFWELILQYERIGQQLTHWYIWTILIVYIKHKITVIVNNIAVNTMSTSSYN